MPRPSCTTIPPSQRVSYLTRQSGQVEYGDQNWSTSIQGVTPSYLDIVSWTIAEGSTMTEQENDVAETVCLSARRSTRIFFRPARAPSARSF